jgi:hypothetical protein
MTRTVFSSVLAITLALAAGAEAKTVKAHVVALDQPIFFNRIGALQPGGMIYALACGPIRLHAGPAYT